MRVLVTGAAGYVGWAAVHELCARGHDVVALVHETSATFPPGVEVRTADLLSAPTLRTDVDGVVHLAGRTTVRDSVAHPTRSWLANVTGTANLLDGLPAGARLVFTSTAAVYGVPARQPIAEDAPFAPLHPYGGSKAAAEQLIGWQAATGAIGAVTLRIFNAAGAAAGRADRDLTRVIPKAVAVAAGRAAKLTVNGDGSAVRDYAHVADIARAIALGLEAAVPGTHKVYNVGAVPASVADIVRATGRVTGRPVAVEHLPPNPNEAPELRADTGRIRAELGWVPRCTTLDELIADQNRYSAATT